jgi:hypothetical protein
MAVNVCLLSLTQDKFDMLYDHAENPQHGGSISAYLKQEYNATLEFDFGGRLYMYQFEPDKYVEFCLTWM